MGPPGQQARIFWYELAQKWAVRAPALADAALMARFTAALRRQCQGVFHHGIQAWVVSDEHLAAAKGIVEKHYRHYQFVARVAPDRSADAHHERPRAQPQESFDYECFCRMVGWSEGTRLSHTEAKALYRRAAAKLHPDVGGCPDKMASLNAAWRAIRDTLT